MSPFVLRQSVARSSVKFLLEPGIPSSSSQFIVIASAHVQHVLPNDGGARLHLATSKAELRSMRCSPIILNTVPSFCSNQPLGHCVDFGGRGAHDLFLQGFRVRPPCNQLLSGTSRTTGGPLLSGVTLNSTAALETRVPTVLDALLLRVSHSLVFFAYAQLLFGPPTARSLVGLFPSFLAGCFCRYPAFAFSDAFLPSLIVIALPLRQGPTILAFPFPLFQLYFPSWFLFLAPKAIAGLRPLSSARRRPRGIGQGVYPRLSTALASTSRNLS